MGVIRCDEFGSDWRLPIPDYIRKRIIYENELDGPCIEWHYDNELEVAAVSSSTSIDGFTYVGRTKVINNGSNIRPPKQIYKNLHHRRSLEMMKTPHPQAVVYYSEELKNSFLYFFDEQIFCEAIEASGDLFDVLPGLFD